jgi:PAS domain S-box-containing protein
MTFDLTREDRRIAVKIVAFYALFGGLWILLSDSLLGWLVRDPDIITRIATYKGLLFIVTTSVLLYFLICRYIAHISDFNRQLKADEARFGAIIATTSDGFYATDSTGCFVDVNEAYCRDSGYTRQELLGMAIVDVEACEQPSEVALHIAKVIASGFDRFESRHRRKDGTLMDVEVSVTYLPEQRRFYSFVRDITEQKRIEKKLRLASFTMANISDAVYWVAADGRFLDVNDSACRMRGYSREEILSMHVADIDPNFPLEVWPQFWDELKRAGSLKFETTHRTRNGQEVEVEVTTNYFRYLDTEYSCGVARDISERKAAERAQREREEDFRSLMELMPVGVACANDNGTIEYINRNFVERFGYEHTEIRTVEEWYLKAYPDAHYRHEITTAWDADIAGCLDYGTPVPPRDIKVTCKDGTVRDVIINTRVSQNRILAIFTDITERESLQEYLIKKQKLESIGVLAGGIAHDFNNILTAILGNISYAGMFIGQGHKSAAPLLQAEKAAKRAAELAHQLLTFARGGQPLTRSLEPRYLLEESLSLVLRGSNVQSRVELPEGLRAVEVDAGQISQAFNNLLINAVQAMPGGGTISIRAANVSIEDTNPFALAPGDYVRFVFKDEGCGISPENLNMIFDPYFTTKSGGNGLGLSSVQSIVSRHGGHIDVRSAVGTGTTFEILLPASSRSACPHIATPNDTAGGCRTQGVMSLLVMDDEEMIRELASAMLEDLGYRVTVCANGDEAVALYKATFEVGVPFSAVIMDLTIPGGMGGLEAAGEIRAIDPQARLVVSSGYSNDPIMADYRQHGFGAVVLKPYGVDEIGRVLAGLLKTEESSV